MSLVDVWLDSIVQVLQMASEGGEGIAEHIPAGDHHRLGDYLSSSQLALWMNQHQKVVVVYFQNYSK